MNHKELVWHCVQALDTFDPEARAVEDHVNQYLKHQTDLSDDDQIFIVEVFSGCVRYTNVLQVIMTGFYNRDGKTCLRSEQNLYKVMIYLVLFRLDELGLAHFRKFVKSQDINKMYRFLNFALSEKHLCTWMKDEWSKLYEGSFVQTTLLSPMQRWMPEIQELLTQLKNKVDAKTKFKRPEYSATSIKPFRLSQPRPRSIPVPQPIPKLQRHKPVPKSVYKEPEEFDVMAKIRETNRRKAEERLMEASKVRFACANPEKSEKTKSIISDIIEEQNSKLEFDKHKSNPVPHNVINDNTPFKLNAAAILREGRLYKQREMEELEKLERLEAGAFDASEFTEWQTRMKSMDANQSLADIERRRLEGKLSHEQAIIARHNVAKQNRKKVVELREEAMLLMEDYMKQQLREEEKRREMVQRVTDTHENAREAKIKMQEFKAKIVQQVVEESKELMKQALEEAEREMEKKMELIRQIRAMEAVAVNRTKLVDLAAPAGYGFLSEMSIAELRERMALLRISSREEEEEKRDRILALKQAKDEELMSTLATISRHRTENSKAAAVRHETRKKTRNVKPSVKDGKLEELQRQLEEKRAERRREQERSRHEPSKTSAARLRQLNNSKKALEESRWRELEMTRERTAQMTSQGLDAAGQSMSRSANRTMLAT